MNISNATKAEYFNSDVDKELIVTFPDLNEGEGLVVDMEHIVYETMTLKESILENTSIEFVGCISSEFSVTLYGVTEELKNERVIVDIQVGDTDPIRLFYGIVDSVEMEANHNRRKITAYDLLYTIGNIEVAKWYNRLVFPKNGMKLGSMRTSLFDYIDAQIREKNPNIPPISQVDITLPCDNILIKKYYKPNTLQSINVIKAICQINGAFGIMNRGDANTAPKFEYRILTETGDREGAFPSDELYPPFYPGVINTGDKPTQEIAYYRGVDYQEFLVKPVDAITIRQTDEDEGYTYDPQELGDDGNRYIIQGNMFTYKLPKKTLKLIATSIFSNVSGFSYRPFESESDGMPWIECGLDNIACYVYDWEHDIYVKRKFTVFSRTMSGIQALKDTYVADGEQDQKLFISDIRSQINVINQKTENVEVDLSDYYNKEEINEMLENLEPTGGWSVESVSTLPAQGQPNVLYLVQGEVVVN